MVEYIHERSFILLVYLQEERVSKWDMKIMKLWNDKKYNLIKNKEDHRWRKTDRGIFRVLH